MSETGSPQRGGQTRENLILAAIDVFGRDGFHAASTRAIAEAAGANQALIGYHFGNKDGLYLAAFAHIADRIQARVGGAVAGAGAVLGENPQGLDVAERRRRYLPLLFAVTDAFVDLMTGEETAHWARLIIREQQAPSPAFDLLYERVMQPFSNVAITLVQRLDPDLALDEAKLIVVTTIGQVLVFRTAQAAVLRIMNWPAISGPDVARIKNQIQANLDARFRTTEVTP